MSARVMFLGFAALICTAECVQVSEVQYAGAEITAFDIRGDNLSPLEAELIDINTGKKMLEADRGRFDRIPYGLYRLRVRAQGFYTVERDVSVYQPKVAFRVQLSLSEECRVYASLIGTSLRSKRIAHCG